MRASRLASALLWLLVGITLGVVATRSTLRPSDGSESGETVPSESGIAEEVGAPVCPVAFLPLEELEHRIRSLVDGDHDDEYRGTAYDILNLNRYIGQWWRTQRHERVQLADWEFFVAADDEARTVLSGECMVAGMTLVIGDLDDPGRRAIPVSLWARRIPGGVK